MRVYISGPMMGKPNGNVVEFELAARKIRAAGHWPINPAAFTAAFGPREEVADAFRELYASHAADYPMPNEAQLERLELARGVMRADIEALKTCDAICLLPGWEKSTGAKRELAEALRMDIAVTNPEDYAR